MYVKCKSAVKKRSFARRTNTLVSEPGKNRGAVLTNRKGIWSQINTQTQSQRAGISFEEPPDV